MDSKYKGLFLSSKHWTIQTQKNNTAEIDTDRKKEQNERQTERKIERKTDRQKERNQSIVWQTMIARSFYIDSQGRTKCTAGH